jgi:type IV secretory pathway TraG/TraD family ATPase VirD4
MLLTVGPFILAGLCGLLWLATTFLSRGTHPSTHAAGQLGRAPSLEERAARDTAARLGVDSPGLTIGTTVRGGRTLLQGWEDCSVDVGGPRSGKTTARVIPVTFEAPGPVVVTSNKADAVAATRGARARHGHVWVLDPQSLAGEAATWTWDPLSFVTDETRAAELASVFAASDRDARADAYFTPKGQEVLASLLLAGACAGRNIGDVYRWCASARDDEPVLILREHRYGLLADGLAADFDAPPKQRAGVFSTAAKSLAFAANRATLEWAVRTPDRPCFDPATFVAGRDTLYLLSKEGAGSAAALTGALTVAVCTAAEDLAKSRPNGRLQVPLTAVLDEACNVCRWPALPALFSHYGSRGVALLVFAQSWSQLEEAFGRNGARAMWSAATVRLVGAGVGEGAFLSELSSIIGEYDEQLVTTGHSRAGKATSHSLRRRRILDVSELAALPKGRAVVLSAGAAPALVNLVPYWTRRDLG